MLGKASLLDYFRKPADPKDLVRKWQADLRGEQRGLERQIRDLQREEKAAAKNVRDAAKRGDVAGARTLAKEIVRTRRVTTQLYTNKVGWRRGGEARGRLVRAERGRRDRAADRPPTPFAVQAHLIDMNARLAEQLGVVKVAGTLQKSGEVMKLVNRLATVPALAKTVQAMGREMVKAGVIEDMVADAVDGALDDVGVDDEADVEVDKILTEVAGADLAGLAASAAPVTKVKAAAAAEGEESEGEMDELKARLEAVRS